MAPDVEMQIKPETHESEQDPFLITLRQEENPMEWKDSKKWLVTDVLSATGFNRIMVSTIIAPALPTITREFNMSASESVMALSIFSLATAIGPLFIGPLSEMYGRQPVLHLTGLWFLVWNIVCGFATTKGVLTGSRFMAGLGASAVQTLGGGVLSDIWSPQQRGKTLGMFLLIPLLGVAVGPIIGGLISSKTQWRWSFWATSAFQGVMMIVSIFWFEETYVPTLLKRKAKKMRKTTGDERYYAAVERQQKQSFKTRLAVAAVRPLKLLAFHPIIQIAALVDAFEYGVLYIVLSTFADMWITRYHQSAAVSGLHYIAIALGEIAGSQVGGWLIDRLYRRAARGTSEGVPLPEHRIPLNMAATVLVPIGLIIYGWTIQFKQVWISVDIAIFVTLFAGQISGMALQAYALDVYTEYASSAMAAKRFPSAMAAFLFPLFATKLYSTLDYGWGNTLIAGLSLMLGVPLALVIFKCGMSMRQRIRLE